MSALIAMVLLPLAVIGLQLALDLNGLWGVAGYSLYKICFLVPPLIYCRSQGIGLCRDILKLQNWRRGLPLAVSLGGLAVLIFWGTYYALGDVLLDRAMIAAKIGHQFNVTPETIFLIAPVTIFFNSLLEEFFYRGFAFGLLVRKHCSIGYLLPAAVFTLQHVLFIYHWVTPLPFCMAVGGLFVFAVVLQRMYQQADSIVSPWLVHIFGDIAMMGIAFTMLQG